MHGKAKHIALITNIMARAAILQFLLLTDRRSFSIPLSSSLLLIALMRMMRRLLHRNGAGNSAVILRVMLVLRLSMRARFAASHRLDYIKGISYIAHAIHPAGRRISFTWPSDMWKAILVFLMCLLEKRPPFISIDSVVEEFCSVLKEYNIYECVGDRYAAGFTTESFRKHGVEYRHSDKTTSDYFSGFPADIKFAACAVTRS